MRSVFLSHLLPRSVVALEFLLTLYCARERREGVKYAVALKVVGHRAEERAVVLVGGPALPREVGAGFGRANYPFQKKKARKDLSTTMTERRSSIGQILFEFLRPSLPLPPEHYQWGVLQGGADFLPFNFQVASAIRT